MELERKRSLFDAVTDGRVRDDERLVEAVVRDLRKRPVRRAAHDGQGRSELSGPRARAPRRPRWGRRPG